MMVAELIEENEDDGSKHVLESNQFHSSQVKIEDVLRRLLANDKIRS